ncbi:MAG TPA: BadF/BadG/BcrA/BcrD ATPase family protein, partial [Planctomycetaceae bacterium]|nr:BadF/BadG/BcrA/BcrD ATPase family protein [Planctomycetaceae bacterium]
AQRRGISPGGARGLLERAGGYLRRALNAPLSGDSIVAVERSRDESEGAAVERAPPAHDKPVATADLVLGIDGGGSKTSAWLARQGKADPWDIIGRGVAGPSNPKAVGFTVAFANLDVAIDAAFQQAGLPPQEVSAACGALAGSDRETDRRRIEAWAQGRKLARRLQLVHDAMPLLAAGTPEGWGVALIAGTGSLAFGRNAQGDAARAGGWGYLLGDEGSGYAIVCRALQATAHAADGRGPQTELLPRFLKKLDVAQPSELVIQIYRPEIDRPVIATWADIVFDAAAAGDSVATQIVAQGARDLAGAVVAVCRKVGLDNSSFPLAAGGGLLIHQPSYCEAVVAALEQSGLQAAPVSAVAEPVAGAVLLARQTLETT